MGHICIIVSIIYLVIFETTMQRAPFDDWISRIAITVLLMTIVRADFVGKLVIHVLCEDDSGRRYSGPINKWYD